MHLEAEALEALLEFGAELGRVRQVLESYHEIVCIAHDDNFTARAPRPPPLCP